MSLTPDGWFDWMARDPGPPEKQYFDRLSGLPLGNTATVYIPHSAVGDNYLAWRDGRLWNMTRLPDGNFTPAARASLHGWINKSELDGCRQHYPIWTACWSSGSFRINVNAVAFENQGGAPGNEAEPLTEYQVWANARIIQELSQVVGWIPQRPTSTLDLWASLYQHNECIRFGSLPTACPSGRIPWDEIIRRLEPPPMSQEDAAELERLRNNELLLKALADVRYILIDGPTPVTRELVAVEGDAIVHFESPVIIQLIF
mgnify:CR=1 FL=1